MTGETSEVRSDKRKQREEGGKEKKMSWVNYYQSAFNSQKDKIDILAEMLEISKTGLDL